jgi:hypothetical protein
MADARSRKVPMFVGKGITGVETKVAIPLVLSSRRQHKGQRGYGTNNGRGQPQFGADASLDPVCGVSISKVDEASRTNPVDQVDWGHYTRVVVEEQPGAREPGGCVSEPSRGG